MKKRRIVALLLSLMIATSAFYACNSDSKGGSADGQQQTESGKKNKNNDNSIKDDDNSVTMGKPGSGNTEGSQNIIMLVPGNSGSDSNIPQKSSDDTVTAPEAKYTSPLTGLATTEALATQRPVAIMFNNLKAALPQHGISQMEVVYEAIVEGSITRLMGVATDWSSLPTLGSIRSSRDYYIDFADCHNAIYVHAGGSELAYAQLGTRKTNNIDGTNGNRASVNAFYRNQERLKKGLGKEHTLFTSGSALATAIAGNKYPTTLKSGFVSPFKFSSNPLNMEGSAAKYVYVPFSTYAQSYFDYDAESGLYLKGQYLGLKSSLDKHDSPHVDGNNNEQLAFKNIIILFTKYTTVDSVGRQAIQFTGSGTGYYITDGKCKPIKWNRESRTGGYTLYESDGTTELLLNRGKTYVGTLKTNTKVVYK